MNYFNYFTEIEEHFQQARGTGLFLVSPLDWAMIETWKDAGIPIEAVHKGINRAFEKWHARKRKIRMINSLAYCAQEVLTAASQIDDVGVEAKATEPAFRGDELARFFRRNAKVIRQRAGRELDALRELLEGTAASLDQLAEAAERDQAGDLEAIEQRLTVLDQRMTAAAMQAMAEDELLNARQEMDRQLAPYRTKMTAEQLALLEKQYLDRKCLDGRGLPRLSLFYL